MSHSAGIFEMTAAEISITIAIKESNQLGTQEADVSPWNSIISVTAS